MKLSALIPLIVLVLTFSLHAQKVDSKHTNYYKIPDAIEGDGYKVEFYNIVAKASYAKMGVKITNNGIDFLMYNCEETKFVYDFGEFNPEEKTFFISPNSDKTKTIKVEGGTQFHVDEFVLDFSGLYLLPSRGKSVEVEEFKLPPAKNDITVGDFIIRLLKTKQTTKETYAKFECQYSGNDIAVIDPTKISIRVNETDIVYANDNRKAKALFLNKGEKGVFVTTFHIPGKIADMQFSEMYISWGETFKSVVPKEVAKENVKFVVDVGLTHGKN